MTQTREAICCKQARHWLVFSTVSSRASDSITFNHFFQNEVVSWSPARTLTLLSSARVVLSMCYPWNMDGIRCTMAPGSKGNWGDPLVRKLRVGDIIEIVWDGFVGFKRQHLGDS